MPHFKYFGKKPSCLTKTPPAGQTEQPRTPLSGLVLPPVPEPVQSGGQPADDIQDLPLSRKTQPSPADLLSMQNLVRTIENAKSRGFFDIIKNFFKS